MDKSKKLTQIKRKPVQMKGSELAHPITNQLPKEASSAVLAVADIFTAPPDLPNIACAIPNVTQCLDYGVNDIPQAKTLMTPLVKGLQLASNVGDDYPHQPLALAGRKVLYPAWHLITSEPKKLLVVFKKLIGFELINSYILQKRLGQPLAEKLTILVQKTKLEEDDRQWLATKMLESLKKAKKTVAARLSGVSTQLLGFNAQVNVYLHTQLSARNVVKKQAAGRRNELPQRDVRTILIELKKKVQTGDFRATIQCTAFCLGLSVELTLRVPIQLSDRCDAVVSIDPVAGTNYCNLTDVLSTLAKTGPPRSLPAGLEYYKPFPLFLAKFWRVAIAAHPTAKVIGDIENRGKSRYSTRIQDTKIAAGIPITESRLVASRGAVFLNVGVQRDTAAYAATALFLLDKSDYHYLQKKPEDIWRACNKVFIAIG